MDNLYTATNKPPDWVPLLLNRWLNTAGKPAFRLVWSEDRLEYRYGELKRKYGEGRNRWIIEKWCPPEMYGSPEEWESTRDPETKELILGPFPKEGEYEHCFTFDVDGTFVLPTYELVELLCRCIERGKLHTRSQKWKAIQDAKEQAKRAESQRFSDIFDDAMPAFDKSGVGQEFVAPGKIGARPKKPEDFKINLTTKDLPANLPKRGLKQLSGPVEKN